MLGLTFLFAAVVATATATGYIDGQEYVYTYKGFMYIGYPRIKHQYSGNAYESNLIIQPHGDYALMKLTNIKKTLFNGEFENVAEHPFDYHDVPESAFNKPFKVYRKNGVVTHFEVSKGEPAFIVNVKRGLISFFNLNFEEADSAVSTEDNDIQKPDPDRHYYKVYEKGLLGDCETSYVIEHHPYHNAPHNNIVLNVTKVKNYHKCNSSPNVVHGTFYGHECGYADHEKAHTLHGNAQYKYNIRGHRHNYVIEKIYNSADMAYTPYPLEGQTVTSKLNVFLTLVDERPITNLFDMGPDTDTYSSLEYSFAFQKNYKDPVDLKQPHYLYHIYQSKISLDVIRGQFEELVKVYNDDTYQEKMKDKNFPVKFLELVKSASTLGYDDINDLYKQYADIPKTGASLDQKKFRSLFVDVLVNLGTNPANLFCKYLIENKKARPQEALYFFNQLPAHVKEISETTLDGLQSLCEHESVKKIPSVHNACIFALSNLVHDHCVARYHPEVSYTMSESHCQPKDAVKYFEYVARKFEAATDEKEKLVYLRSAGNIGLREILPYVKSYIEGAGDYHRYFRYSAIWAAARVGFRFPDRVKDLLVPLLFNQTEHYELRISAFILLLLYRPSLYELEGITRGLRHDPNDQFRSFVYKSLRAMANSKHFCDRKISKISKYALRFLDEYRHEFEKYDYSYSTDTYTAGYDSNYDFGGSTRFSYFASDTGYIPRVVYLGLEDFIGGKSMETFSIVFNQYGIEKFLDKILGPEGSFGQRSMFDLFKKRGKRDAGGVEKELNEIKGKIKLPVVDYGPIHGDIFIKYMGNNYALFHFDDHSFEDFFKEGRFTIPNIPPAYQKIPQFFYQRFMLTMDKMYIIPTDLGVPVFFDYKQPVYYYHKNKESSFKVEPGFFAEERGGKFPDHVKLETDGHIAIDKNMIASIGVFSFSDQATYGAGINRRAVLSLPLKIKLDLDVKSKKLNHQWTPVKHEIYHFKYEPYTFTDLYGDGLSAILEKSYQPIQRKNRKHLHESYLHDALGVGFDVHALYENDFNDKGSWLNFLFNKDFRQKFYYLYANPNFEPYYVDIQLSHAATGATKEVQASVKYQYYDSEHTQPEFSTEGFEDYKITDDENGPFCTCALEFELKGLGDKERKANGKISWTRDLKRSNHKVNIYYNRSPFHSSETLNMKICGSSYLKYPKYDLLKVVTFDTIGMNHQIDSALKLHFGKDCSTDQKIKIDGQFVTTEEQRLLESKREEPGTLEEHYNPYAYYYQTCLKKRAINVNYGDICLKYIRFVGTVFGYNFHGKFENLSKRFLNATYKGLWAAKHVLYNYGDHNIVDVQNPQNEFHLHANFSVRLPVGDIRVHKPRSNSHYTHVRVPFYAGLRSYPEFEDMHIKNSLSDIRCTVEGNTVVTFDTYEYKLPPIACYKVIAKDCSPNELFTILTTKINHPIYHQALKVFIGKHKVEALPVSDDSGIIIRVDGTKVEVTATKPYLHFEGEHRHHGADFYITFRSFFYALHSEKYGLIIEFDGLNIIVKVSPFYRNKLCGLCGNYNGLKYDGSTTTGGCYYENESAYAYAYAIPSDTCEVPKFELKCPNEGGFGCTKLRTKIVEHNTGKGAQTCFSTEPIAECAPHCKARATTSKKISLHCLPAKDDSTKALVRQQPLRVLHEFRKKSKDHEVAVDVPDVCLKV